MKKTKNTLQSLFIMGLALFSTNVYADINALSPEVRTKEYSLSEGALALGGYDPVAYFEGGPAKGSSEITETYKGVVYHFASVDNHEKFKENPTKYEPQYGGWCAWAMADGQRTKANPKSYKLVDGKLYVFYDRFFIDTREKWNDYIAEYVDASGNINEAEGESHLIGQADTYWSNQVL